MPKLSKKEERDSIRSKQVGKLRCPHCGYQSLIEQRFKGKVHDRRTGRSFKCRTVQAVCSNCWKSGTKVVDDKKISSIDVMLTLV